MCITDLLPLRQCPWADSSVARVNNFPESGRDDSRKEAKTSSLRYQLCEPQVERRSLRRDAERDGDRVTRRRQREALSRRARAGSRERVRVRSVNGDVDAIGTGGQRLAA